jgi:hypothetical protein
MINSMQIMNRIIALWFIDSFIVDINNNLLKKNLLEILLYEINSFTL